MYKKKEYLIVEKTTAGIDQTTRRMFCAGILSFHVTMLIYRTVAKNVLWEFDYIIIQNMSDIFFIALYKNMAVSSKSTRSYFLAPHTWSTSIFF